MISSLVGTLVDLSLGFTSRPLSPLLRSSDMRISFKRILWRILSTLFFVLENISWETEGKTTVGEQTQEHGRASTGSPIQ